MVNAGILSEKEEGQLSFYRRKADKKSTVNYRMILEEEIDSF